MRAMQRLLGWLGEGMAHFSVLSFAQGCAVVCTIYMINNPRI